MVDIKISEQDLEDAENFLVEFMTEQVPEADFNKGTSVRDLAIKAFTYLFAYLRGEVDTVLDRQSLLRIDELEESDDIAQAADEILSNWFISRKGGDFSRGTATIHFSANATVHIDTTTVFWRTDTQGFRLNIDSNSYVIPEYELLPTYDTRGELVDYVADVPLIALDSGEGGNIDAGLFVRVDAPSGQLPFFSYAENTAPLSGGYGYETTEELVERAQTAITVRNLINNRSCDTVLQEEYPEITDTLTIGMGESEMVRDVKKEIASHIEIHTGGYYDTYIGLELATVSESGEIGGYFARPDNIIAVFRDPLLTYGDGTPGSGELFGTDLGVAVGDVIFIRTGLAGGGMAFPIVEVKDHELHVSTATPFTEAYDETTPDATARAASPLVYSIGHTSPNFEDIDFNYASTPPDYVRTADASTDPDWAHVPVGTSRHITEAGVIVLQGRPMQAMEWVELTDPDPVDAAMIDPGTQTILFPNRVNSTPVGPMAEPSLMQYQVEVLNPASTQSTSGVTLIRVGYLGDTSHFDGQTLLVRYKTLQTFTDIDTYATDRDRRVVAANHLIRARHPVWVSAMLPYKLSNTATGTVDEDAAAIFLANYINSFDPNDDLDMSDLATQFRIEYPDVGVVYQFLIYYQLEGPDGQVARFSTEDVVSIFPEDDNGVSLLNGSDLVAPIALSPATNIDTSELLRGWYSIYGLSDRTVRYRTLSNLITFLLRS